MEETVILRMEEPFIIFFVICFANRNSFLSWQAKKIVLSWNASASVSARWHFNIRVWEVEGYDQWSSRVLFLKFSKYKGCSDVASGRSMLEDLAEGKRSGSMPWTVALLIIIETLHQYHSNRELTESHTQAMEIGVVCEYKQQSCFVAFSNVPLVESLRKNRLDQDG